MCDEEEKKAEDHNAGQGRIRDRFGRAFVAISRVSNDVRQQHAIRVIVVLLRASFHTVVETPFETVLEHKTLPVFELVFASHRRSLLPARVL